MPYMTLRRVKFFNRSTNPPSPHVQSFSLNPLILFALIVNDFNVFKLLTILSKVNSRITTSTLAVNTVCWQTVMLAKRRRNILFTY